MGQIFYLIYELAFGISLAFPINTLLEAIYKWDRQTEVDPNSPALHSLLSPANS